MFRIKTGFYIVYIVPFLFISHPIAASYRIGLKGGLFLSMFYGKDAHLLSNSEIVPRKDFSASLFFRTEYNAFLSTQIELIYAKKGHCEYLNYNSTFYERPDFFSRSNRWEELYKLDYMELPLLLAFRVLKSGKNEVSLYTGPFLALLFAAKKNISANEAIICQDIQPATPAADYGIATGIEYEFRLGRGRLSFDIRYSIGFGLTHRPTEIDLLINPVAQSSDRKNSVLLFMTGYAYDL